MPKYSTFKASKIAIIGAIETNLKLTWNIFDAAFYRKSLQNLRSDEQQRVGVREWISHPNFVDDNAKDNDFAILKLSRWAMIGRNNAELWLVRSHVSFSALVSPACLPSSALNNYNAVQAEVTGWGLLSNGGSTPDLQKVKNDTYPERRGRSIIMWLL